MASPCVVIFCKNIGNHRFPKDETRRSKWIKAVKHLKPGFTIRTNSFVCSSHFTPADFISQSIHSAGGERSRNILKRNAVPSLFPWNVARQKANQLQQQSEPIFNPTNVKATYSRTPRVAFVEIPPMLESDVKVEEIDPMDISINSDSDNIVPITSVKQEIDIEIDVKSSPPPYLQEPEDTEYIKIEPEYS